MKYSPLAFLVLKPMTEYYDKYLMLAVNFGVDAEYLQLEDNVDRFSVVFESQSDKSYTLSTFETQAEAIDHVEWSIANNHEWLPIYLVDLVDLSSRPITFRPLIELGEIIGAT